MTFRESDGGETKKAGSKKKKRADEEKKNGSREVKLRKRGRGADGEV